MKDDLEEAVSLRDKVAELEAMLHDVGLGLLADRDEREQAAARLAAFWNGASASAPDSQETLPMTDTPKPMSEKVVTSTGETR